MTTVLLHVLCKDEKLGDSSFKDTASMIVIMMVKMNK